MSLKWVTLDVFTEQRYRGNPVAIIHVPASVSLQQSQKQLITREFNLSESVFLHEQTETDKQNGDVRIDIFTPIAEIPFAGHPTVGTSNYLLRYLADKNSTTATKEEWQSSSSSVQALQVKAGRIPIQLTPDKKGTSLQVAHNVHIHNNNPFPNRPFSYYPVVSIVKGMTFLLAKLDSLEELGKQTQSLLGTENTYKVSDALDQGWRQGPVICYFYVDMGTTTINTKTTTTTKRTHEIGQEGSDNTSSNNTVRQIRTRSMGSREDPATGSAASALTSYLTLTEDGPAVRKYQITQGVEMGRKSIINIQVTVEEDAKAIKEVLLTGSAVKVMEGTLEIPAAEEE